MWQGIAEAVWSLRRSAATWWPTPPTGDALRFAFCEAGEALDALLRENPAYARNHARERLVEEELVQCAIMLMTALGEDWRYGHIDCAFPDGRAWTDEVARCVGLALAEFVAAPQAPTWRVWAEVALIAIARQVGMEEVPELVDRELARVEARHLPERLRQAVAACGRVADH